MKKMAPNRSTPATTPSRACSPTVAGPPLSQPGSSGTYLRSGSTLELRSVSPTNSTNSSIIPVLISFWGRNDRCRTPKTAANAWSIVLKRPAPLQRKLTRPKRKKTPLFWRTTRSASRASWRA